MPEPISAPVAPTKTAAASAINPPGPSPLYPEATEFTRVKGVARGATGVLIGIPTTAFVSCGSFAIGAGLSILQILLAGLFSIDPKNKLFETVQKYCGQSKDWFIDKGEKMIYFERDQLKEALCEICNHEDFDRTIRENPFPDEIKRLANLPQKQKEEEIEQIILDDEGVRSGEDMRRSLGLNAETGQQR